ncbi:hypothetical protein L6452_19527 [Arctium lappa]|uniref:Uncharacterized protein n=1 Tax=Arctium lappa TaxID=4217 RepID=A0ACB9B988_ARCLA|nr:hypothetical protein L6452_19527 [Arctium lappa]
MNIPNLNLALDFAASLDMVLSTRVISAGILSPSVFVYLVTLPSGNMFLFLLYPSFVSPLLSPLHSLLMLPSHWTHSNLTSLRLRLLQVPSHLRDYHVYATLLSNHEPTSYKEASSNPDRQKAMAEELHALDKAQTWESVPLPPGKSPIGSKWVIKIKTKSDGSIDRYKSRLVANCFNQEYDIDYEETFAPVA